MPGTHASRLATAWVADPVGSSWRTLEGSVVLADLSGFTRLTEVLAGTGAEGVEHLHRVLMRTFGALLGPSLDLGGDVLGFAGDAALVWFDGDQHAVRAVDAARRMPGGLAALPASTTGGTRLHVSVGVHTGQFTAVLAGDRRRALFVVGPEMSTVVRLQGRATGGQVLMSAAVADQVPAAWRGPAVGDAIEVKRSTARRTAATLEAVPPGAAVDVDAGRSLLSPAVWDLVSAGNTTSDHRAASVGFVHVPGLDLVLADGGPDDLHRLLHHVATVVEDVTAQLGVDWLDVDVGVGSVKLMLAAGAPRSIDDDEDRLLLALRRILDETSVPLRAGAQRGRVFAAHLGVARRSTYTVLGDPVNVAARALGFADDGELVVGDGMGADTRPHVRATFLGPMSLKNRLQPMPMWRVATVAPRAATARAATPEVVETGRRPAWRDLSARWKHTVDAAGCDVVVVSESGMGGSELLAALADLAGSAATLVVAHPFQRQVPYAAIRDIAAALAAARGTEPPDPIAWLHAAGGTEAPDARADHADAPTTALRSRVRLAAALRAASPRPWLLAVDDIDRIDDASRGVLDELAATVADEQVMLVATVERGSSHRPASTELVLEPLDDDSSTALVREVAPALRDDEVARIVAAGKGNPFVLAELARSPRHDGDLPDSLQRLGAALIDDLPAAARTLVRDTSAFGTTVEISTVAEVLQRKDLLERGAWTAAFPVLRADADGTVSFRHDALRVAAHASLPFRRRRDLHAAIAAHLASSADSSAAVLAFHFEEAGLAHQAFPLARTAGMEAKDAGAMSEACDLLERAVRLAAEVAPHEVGALHLELGDARSRLGDLDGAERSLAAATRRLTDPLDHARACHHRADVALTRGNAAQARTWVRKGLAIVEPLGDTGGEALGRLLLDRAAVFDVIGRPAKAVESAQDALALAERIDHRVLTGLAHMHLMISYLSSMAPEALDHAEAAVEIFDSIGHDRYLTNALINSGLIAMYLGRWNEAVAMYERAADHGRRCGSVVDRALVEMNLGFLLYRQGRLDEAEVHGRRALRTFQTVQVTHPSGVCRYLLSQVSAAEGAYAEATELLATARSGFVEIDDAAMVVDCDVATMEQLLLAGRNGAVRAAGAGVAARLGAAEPSVRVTYERVLGQAEAASGDESGVARIERAAALASEHQLVFERFQCLGSLIAVDAADQSVRAEHAAIRDRLGIVVR